MKEGESAPTPRNPARPPGGGPDPGDLVGEWTAFFGASARTYLDLFEDMNTRAVSGVYSPSDWLADGSRFWSRMAKDWVQAWTYGLDRLPEAVRDPGGTRFAPPPTPSTASSARALSAIPSDHARADTRGARAPSGRVQWRDPQPPTGAG